MVSSCKRRAELKALRGRQDAGKFNLSVDHLLKIYNKQDGKCYYSGIKLTTQKNSNWRCSPERLDNSFGYVEGNVVLVIAELNGTTQMNIDKICFMVTNAKVDNQAMTEECRKMLEEAKIPLPRLKIVKHKSKILNSITIHQCKFCNEFKPKEDFQKNVNEGCIICQAKNWKIEHNSLRGRIKDSIKDSKTRWKKWCTNGDDSRGNYGYDLTFESVLDLFERQNGRCAYSNVPLSPKSGDWLMSIERIDTRKSYTMDNICLIAYKLNIGDCRAISNTEDGTYWDKDKMSYFINNVNL